MGPGPFASLDPPVTERGRSSQVIQGGREEVVPTPRVPHLEPHGEARENTDHVVPPTFRGGVGVPRAIRPRADGATRAFMAGSETGPTDTHLKPEAPPTRGGVAAGLHGLRDVAPGGGARAPLRKGVASGAVPASSRVASRRDFHCGGSSSGRTAAGVNRRGAVIGRAIRRLPRAKEHVRGNPPR